MPEYLYDNLWVSGKGKGQPVEGCPFAGCPVCPGGNVAVRPLPLRRRLVAGKNQFTLSPGRASAP